MEYSELSEYFPPPSEYVRAATVAFEDGTEVYYGGDRESVSDKYDPRYDPTLDVNYVSKILQSKAPRIRWTYTFTNADYDAAVAQQTVE